MCWGILGKCGYGNIPPLLAEKIRQIISFFVGDEVTSLKFLWFLKGKLETPHVVCYSFNRLSGRQRRTARPIEMQIASPLVENRRLNINLERAV